MPDQMIATSTEPSILPDRAETLVQVRAELRDNHPRLTDKQIDLIADVAVELRLAQIRLGVVTTPSLPAALPVVRMRVPALVGDSWDASLEA
ncbi:MAG TPA: hypothetical protein VFS59_18185 [Gemmatimonadaceae bacterium]|nr:hypothetical protein [Gemmatimonadaceae bacterium]